MSYRLWYLFSCIQRPHRSVNICIWLDYWYSLYLTFLLTPWLSSENMETYQATRNTPKGEKNNKFNHCTYLLVSRMTISQTQNKEPGNLTNTEALLSQFTRFHSCQLYYDCVKLPINCSHSSNIRDVGGVLALEYWRMQLSIASWGAGLMSIFRSEKKEWFYTLALSSGSVMMKIYWRDGAMLWIRGS